MSTVTDSIESSNSPLVFKVVNSTAPVQSTNLDKIAIRTATRALAGMQKEALVDYGATTWRMVCDEGPWLNGTDLAPFPLGFFTAGLVASYMSEYLSHAKRENIVINKLEVKVDNHYGMEGSLMKGTMIGSALPVEVTFNVEADTTKAMIQTLAYRAVATSPADAYLRHSKSSIFTLNQNDKQIEVTRVNVSDSIQPEKPSALFNDAKVSLESQACAAIIEKCPEIDSLGGEKLGTVKSAAVGLEDNQKRQVHVRGVGTLREDGLKAIEVACFQPIGSVFRLLSDDSALVGGSERAPSGLAYLSAGLSYCFMTQLGRYASVAKQKMNGYQIVQDTNFCLPVELNFEPELANSFAVDTHVYIDTEEDEAATQKLLDMGEQTCYLHAACRAELKTHVRTKNGQTS